MANVNALVPDPIKSDKENEQFFHQDLSELGDTELTDELHHLRPLLWGLDSDHWLRERVEKLEREISKRGGNTDFSGRQKSKPAGGVRL